MVIIDIFQKVNFEKENEHMTNKRVKMALLNLNKGTGHCPSAMFIMDQICFVILVQCHSVIISTKLF